MTLMTNLSPRQRLTNGWNFNRPSSVTQSGNTYTGTEDDRVWFNFVPFAVFDSMRVGDVWVMHATGTFSIAFGPWTPLLQDSDWYACQVTSKSLQSLYLGKGETVTIDMIGWFTYEDWLRVKAMYDAGVLPSPWFSAGTTPLRRG